MSFGRTMLVGLIAACCLPALSHGQCRLEDGSFSSADGGCKDETTGLVWSPDLRALGYPSPTNYLSDAWCNTYLNNSINGNGYTDWRGPSFGELEAALANGLYTHLDYFLDGSPGDDVYYWTTCEKARTKKKRYEGHYVIRHSDGDVQVSRLNENYLVCVRGQPRLDDCEGLDDGGGSGGGKGGGKGKNNSVAESKALASLTLLAPLFLVGAATGIGRRRDDQRS